MKPFYPWPTLQRCFMLLYHVFNFLSVWVGQIHPSGRLWPVNAAQTPLPFVWHWSQCVGRLDVHFEAAVMRKKTTAALDAFSYQPAFSADGCAKCWRFLFGPTATPRTSYWLSLRSCRHLQQFRPQICKLVEFSCFQKAKNNSGGQTLVPVSDGSAFFSLLICSLSSNPAGVVLCLT